MKKVIRTCVLDSNSFEINNPADYFLEIAKNNQHPAETSENPYFLRGETESTNFGFIKI